MAALELLCWCEIVIAAAFVVAMIATAVFDPLPPRLRKRKAGAK